MNFEQIVSDLKNRIYKPVYLLHGEEPYFIDVITDFIADNVLSDTEKAFNQTIFYGKDVDAVAIVEAARRFPMMANQQVIIVKEAQQIKNFKPLESYMVSTVPSTILVLAYKYKKFDKRTKLAKEIDQKGVLFESSKLYFNKIIPWIGSFLDEQAVVIQPRAAALIADCLGSDLSRIASELQKLISILPEGSRQITEDMVKDNIGIHRDFNVFELQKALGMRDSFRAYQIVDYFAKAPKDHPLVFVITQLFDYFNRLIIYHSLTDKSKNNLAAELGVSPYFIDEYTAAASNYSLPRLIHVVSVLRSCDLKSKGIDTGTIDDGDIMKEMVFKILH